MKEMTSLQRCMAVLNGEVPDMLPVIPQSFMYAVETAGLKISDVNKDGRKMAQAHILSQEKYGYDGCVIDFDDASIAEAIGAKVIFREDEPATVDEEQPVLKDLRDIYELPLPDPQKSGRLCEWLEATRTLVDAIGDHVFIMGRADQGPFSIACLLRGTTQFMMDLLSEDPQVIADVIEYCRQASVLFAKAQKDAGAHATSIGDALAGPNLISPDMYRQFALEPEKKMTEEVQAYGIPLSLHICGNTNAIIEDRGTDSGSRLETRHGRSAKTGSDGHDPDGKCRSQFPAGTRYAGRSGCGSEKTGGSNPWQKPYHQFGLCHGAEYSSGEFQGLYCCCP